MPAKLQFAVSRATLILQNVQNRIAKLFQSVITYKRNVFIFKSIIAEIDYNPFHFVAYRLCFVKKMMYDLIGQVRYMIRLTLKRTKNKLCNRKLHMYIASAFKSFVYHGTIKVDTT